MERVIFATTLLTGIFLSGMAFLKVPPHCTCKQGHFGKVDVWHRDLQRVCLDGTSFAGPTRKAPDALFEATITTTETTTKKPGAGLLRPLFQCRQV